MQWHRTLGGSGSDFQELIGGASAELRNEMILYVHDDMLQSSEILRLFNRRMTELLVSRLRAVFHAPNEMIFTEGQIAHHIYIIKRGLVEA